MSKQLNNREANNFAKNLAAKLIEGNIMCNLSKEDMQIIKEKINGRTVSADFDYIEGKTKCIIFETINDERIKNDSVIKEILVACGQGDENEYNPAFVSCAICYTLFLNGHELPSPCNPEDCFNSDLN